MNRELAAKRCVIAPGGSVVYGQSAMEHLKEISEIVYLKLSYEELEQRLGDLTDRGVVLRPGMTLRDLYEERRPLYEKYADITVSEGRRGPGAVVDELRSIIETASTSLH